MQMKSDLEDGMIPSRRRIAISLTHVNELIAHVKKRL